MAMTGQLEPNTCGDFYIGQSGCASSSGDYCWSCHRGGYLGQTSNYNWHAHGYGINLHRSGGTDELFNHPDGTCGVVYENGETYWDSFYIVVQE